MTDINERWPEPRSWHFDFIDLLGDDYGPICCKGGCCGPGSYCCGHPDNDHEHEDED